MRFRYSPSFPELQQFHRLVRFSLRRLRFSLRTHTFVLLHSDTVHCPGDNSIRLGRTVHRDKIPPQRIHAACIVTRGSCCTKHFAEFNGNCESYCSLEQPVASLCAAHEGKSASCTYHPKTEGYTRRYLYRPPGLLYCGCTRTRIGRQPTIYNNYLVLFSTNSSRTVDCDRSERFLFR